MMAKKSALYAGWRKKVVCSLCVFLLLSLILSVERTVIDVLGQMWATMLLNCMATVCSFACFLGICAKETIVIALCMFLSVTLSLTAQGIPYLTIVLYSSLLYAVWSILAVGLNLIVILIYQDVGVLQTVEHYIGILVGNDNYWRKHGLMCRHTDFGSGYINASGDGGRIEFAEYESYSCLISYSVVETIHAAIYIFLAVMSLIFCCLLLCPRESEKRYSDEVDEDFCYISEAQSYDFPISQSRSREYNL